MSKGSLYALGMTLLLIVGGTLAVMFGGALIAELSSMVGGAANEESAFRVFVVVMLFILLIRDMRRGTQ